MALKNHGVTANTPKEILFGAGVFYKNLKFETNNWAGTVLGATNGGGKIAITPEYVPLEADGVTVKVKGMTKKVAEAGSMEINLTEINEGLVKTALHLEADETNSVTGFTKLVTKADITEDDYLENIAFVGKRNDGKNIIVIMPNALCTSALELEGANKEQGTYALTFECHADLTAEDMTKLPIEIYTPVASV